MKRGDLLVVVNPSSRFMNVTATKMFSLEIGEFGLVIDEKRVYCEVLIRDGKVVMMMKDENAVSIIISAGHIFT